MATKADALCKNVSSEVKQQAITLANAMIAMQEKIEQQIPIYKDMPIAQQITTTQGEKVLKNNPAVFEFRSLVRDFAIVVKDFNSLIETHTEGKENVSMLDDLKERFKVI